IILSIIITSPRPPLFPYTTLFRSTPICWIGSARTKKTTRTCRENRRDCYARCIEVCCRNRRRACRPSRNCAKPESEQGNRRFERSEEHTSELQSRFDLVCRLLLEK